MPLTVGSRLGPYEIVAAIGAGGMGEVYQATDTNLKRAVALKVLPEGVASDAERLARFQREAEVLASLNHPNIAAIYGLERSSGTTAIVMELVEGPTLADLIAKGLSVPDALGIAGQIADALDAAHERGIVHRDLKPTNVKVTPEGRAKVLDFGLAAYRAGPLASLSAGRAGEELTNSPTITSPAMTHLGTILGTAAYMAPEQARGRVVDKRADIWAFGVVLYEMTTGRRLFHGEDVTDTLASVVKVDPDLGAAPPRVRPLLDRCLQKDPKKRLRDIGDWALLLEPAAESFPTVSQSPPSRIWAALGALAAVAAVLVVWWAPWRVSPELPLTRVRVVFPKGVDSAQLDRFAISPDGRRVAFQARDTGPNNVTRLWLWPLDSTEALSLAGTENAGGPFWSYDGRSVGFVQGTALKRVDITGGPAQTILPDGAGGLTGAWSHDDVILFRNRDGGLSRVASTGGEPTAVTMTTPEDLHHEQPVFLPDGRHFLYMRHTKNPDSMGIFVASIDAAPADQPVTLLVSADDGPVFISGADSEVGHVLFQRQGTLLAQAFDVAARQLRGDPVQIAADAAGGNVDVLLSASATGDLIAYRPGTVVRQRTLLWVDRKGGSDPLRVPPGEYEDPAVSPDGTRVALAVRRSQGRDIWIWHLVRETLTRLTFDEGDEFAPLWTRDGARVVYLTTAGLVARAAAGTGSAETLAGPGGAGFGWGVDDQLVWSTAGGDIGVVTPSGERRTLLGSTFTELRPALSPDGRWMAYQSDESGQFEIYVRPFPNVDEGKWQITTGGGIEPKWSRDGRELFFVASGALMGTRVGTRPTFSFERPTRLFATTDYVFLPRPWSYDISADGKRFVMLVEAGRGETPDDPADLVLIQNWRAGTQK